MEAVIVSATIASVILSFGNDKEVRTAKLVVVTEVATVLVKLVLVVKVIAPLLNAISGVPVTEELLL